MEEGYYVYGITVKNTLHQIDEPSLKKEERGCFVSHRDIKAVVSRVPLNEFGQEILKEKVRDTKWLESKMRAHVRVIEKVMIAQTVIPFKFGTIFQAEESLRKVLEEKYLNFKFLLEKLKNKQEWTVKVYANTEAMKEKVGKDLPKIRALEREISRKPRGAASIVKKQKRAIKEAIGEKTLQYSYQIYKKLKNWAEDVFIRDLLKMELLGEMEMILNTAYLVDRKKRNNFFREFENLKKDFLNQGLELEFSGPLPPCNFVDFSRKVGNGRRKWH